MKKIHFLLILSVAASVLFSCTDDDDTAILYSQTNLIGTYNLDMLRTTNSQIVINPDGSTMETVIRTTEASNIDLNWNFDADGNFVVSGSHMLTIIENDNGVITSQMQQTSLNREGVYTVNESNSTLIFTPVNDTDEIFYVTNFTANGFDARYENVTAEDDFESRFVIELSFIRK